MSGKFTKEIVLNFLREVSVMSIAVNLNDKPISSVVAFYVDNDFSFYFATKRNTYKDQALRRNLKISLSVWEHNRMHIQASGDAREIADQQELDDTVKLIKKSISHLKNFWWPIQAIKAGDYVAYKIHIEWLRVLDLSNSTVEGQERFYQINL